MDLTGKRFVPEEAMDLSPEARSLVTDVRGRMDQWIEENVSRLTSEMSAEINAVVTHLHAQVDDVAKEFAAAREEMDKILSDIEALAENLEAGDGETIASAIQKTRDRVKAVQAELNAREARWKGIGKEIVNTGLTTVASMANISILS